VSEKKGKGIDDSTGAVTYFTRQFPFFAFFVNERALSILQLKP
jgi:hypothetical protein